MLNNGMPVKAFSAKEIKTQTFSCAGESRKFIGLEGQKWAFFFHKLKITFNKP